MARPIIEIPSKTTFSTELSVQISQINYGGHLGNDSVLSIMHEARLQLFKSMGYKNEVEIDNEIGIAMTHANVLYKAEAFHEDKLIVSLGIGQVHKYGLDLVYQLVRVSDGKEIARGETGIVGFHYGLRKIHQLPADFLKKLGL